MIIFNREKIIVLWETIKYHWSLLPFYPRLWWDSLYIRSKEFHRSLEMDIDIYQRMNSHDQKKYINNLIKRRNLADLKDK